MAVARADVLRVAALARLNLSADEIERFTHQLNAILGHVADLETAEAGPPPGAAADESLAAPLRPDEPGPDPLLHPPAAFAVAWADGFFTVPRLPALDADNAGTATES